MALTVKIKRESNSRNAPIVSFENEAVKTENNALTVPNLLLKFYTVFNMKGVQYERIRLF